jgi:succinate-semialdehyde dehydrogenase/glutarate-semialdehyde dehydrogenase
MDTKTSPLALLADPGLLRTDALIGGEWVAANDTSARFAVTDPATGAELAQVANCGPVEAAAAISAAERAWPLWRAKTAKERAAVLQRWFALLTQHADDLARLMTAEQGKPLAEARGEVAYAASFVEWFAEEGKRVYGETIPATDAAKRVLVLKQPIGVCAAITPWNFPIAMITRKVAPALAAGCPVVIKPAEQTPLTALAAAELAQRAGMPAGVLNILPADAARSVDIGAVLCSSDVVRHLSFTGSTEVGRILMRQCAGTVKKLSLELGGNAPFIVFDDADLDSAVDGALASKYRNAGQTCVCANRLYVQAGVHDAFVEKLAARVAAMKVGNGFEPGVAIGPLIDDAAMAKVREHVADALAQGARVVTGGAAHEIAGAEGRFFTPTVLTGVTPGMRCAKEETFGPASYFYSRDIGRIFRVAEALESGMVGINTGIISAAEVPFGGVKQSGLGREGARQGLEEYLEMKYLCLGDVLK